MCKDIKGKVELIKKSVSINTAFSESTTKDLFTIHIGHMLKQLNSAMLRSKALSQLESPKDTVETQLKYFEDVSNELSEITGEEIHLLKFYKNKLIEIVEENITQVPFMPVSYRVTEGEQISVVNVQKNDARMSRLPTERAKSVH